MENEKVCIIIPCYNEGKRLPIKDFETFIAENEVHFCFVNDGSKDNTIQVLQQIQEKFKYKVQICDLNPNIGKANAVRQGILSVYKNYDYVGYLDADLATPLYEINNLMNEFASNTKLKLVFGSRILTLNSSIERKAYRHYFGRIIATCISIILQLNIYDTQCGAKLFKKELVEECFEKEFISRWLFDVEIFKRIKAITGKNAKNIIKEMPLQQWIDVDESKITFFDMLKVPLELLKIYWCK